MTTAQIQSLANELNNDPRGYGFAAFIQSGNDSGLADAVNLIRDGSAGRVPTTPTAAGGQASGIITVKRNDVRPVEMLQAIDSRDFVSAADKALVAWFQALANVSTFSLVNPDGSATMIQSNLGRLVGNTQGSQTRMLAIGSRSGSRAEELFGTGSFVGSNDISLALRGV